MRKSYLPVQALSLLLMTSMISRGGDGSVTYSNWTSGVTKRLVASFENRHVIHSYYTNTTESPDGRYVLYYTSGVANGEQGDLRILERATGKETIVARDVVTEDAHRVANQQWVDGGKTIVYQNFRDGRWFVMAIDLNTLQEKVLAEDRQLGFCATMQAKIPVVGCHWKPGDHRDLELVNVETGKIEVAVTIDAVKEKYGEWLQKRFGQDAQLSICFPDLSPDGTKVFFKIAHGSGGDDFHSSKASDRDGKVVYDLEKHEFIRLSTDWGHPSWHPDSKQIFEKGNKLLNLETGKGLVYVPGSPSDHPSLSPNAQVFVTDGKQSKKEKEWIIAVGNTQANEYTIIDKFDNTQGATSWRHNHPHPVFSSDGRRIYYNVNDGPWTKLYVAEIGGDGKQ